MAYKQLRQGGGNYLKWDVPKEVEGVIVGYEQGEYKGKPTSHVVLTQADGTNVKCPVHATISSVNSLEAPVGSRLKLVFKGKEVGMSGTKYNDIEAFLEVPDGTEGAVAGVPGAIKASDTFTGAPAVVPTQAPPAAAAPAPVITASAVDAALSDYYTDLATLELLNPAMAKQLPVVFPDHAVRARKLKDVLAQLRPA